MWSKIHILQVKRLGEPQRDEYNRIVSNSTETWEQVCECRCDDNNDKHFKNNNGEVYTPQYHIVCEGKVGVNSGDEVRCLNKDGSIRGQGKVFNVKRLNILNYSEVWV